MGSMGHAPERHALIPEKVVQSFEGKTPRKRLGGRSSSIAQLPSGFRPFSSCWEGSPLNSANQKFMGPFGDWGSGQCKSDRGKEVKRAHLLGILLEPWDFVW